MDERYVDRLVAPEWLAGMDKIPEVTQYKEVSYKLLELVPEMTVLDLGCGIGDDAERMLSLVQPGGSVIGIDARADMIQRARDRHIVDTDAPQSGRLEFLVGSAEGIPLADGSCDVARADRLLQHVSDPLVVLNEVERVLRPGDESC